MSVDEAVLTDNKVCWGATIPILPKPRSSLADDLAPAANTSKPLGMAWRPTDPGSSRREHQHGREWAEGAFGKESGDT